MSAAAAANGRHKPSLAAPLAELPDDPPEHAGGPATLFEREEIDKGIVPGLGHVVIRSAVLADCWSFLEMAGKPELNREFGMRLVAASVTFDGASLTYDEILRAPISRLTALQGLLPDVTKVNEMIVTGSADAGETGSKNAAGVGEGAA